MSDHDEDDRLPVGDLVYREPARSWTSVWVLLAVLLGLFAVDRFVFTGHVAIGAWIVAIALVAGIYWLVVYAARATKSLVLTTDELWVGEEVISRDRIVGVDAGLPAGGAGDLAVLGWPTGRSRLGKAVTVRLVDDLDVLIPTRDVERLAGALGNETAAPRAFGEVRPATVKDLDQLADIDKRAGIIFGLAGYELPETEFPSEELAHALAVLVVGDPPQAFLWLREVDGLAYVEELSVLPGAMRRGVGTRLLESACEFARDAGYPAITLITYADVVWNAPYYAERGFAVTDDVTPGLATIRAVEAEIGLDAVGHRVVMRRELS